MLSISLCVGGCFKTVQTTGKVSLAKKSTMLGTPLLASFPVDSPPLARLIRKALGSPVTTRHSSMKVLCNTRPKNSLF